MLEFDKVGMQVKLIGTLDQSAKHFVGSQGHARSNSGQFTYRNVPIKSKTLDQSVICVWGQRLCKGQQEVKLSRNVL